MIFNNKPAFTKTIFGTTEETLDMKIENFIERERRQYTAYVDLNILDIKFTAWFDGCYNRYAALLIIEKPDLRKV